MLNYIKSELYRITRSNTFYALMLGFAAAPLCMNILLFCFKATMADFPYGTTSFSYSALVSNPMLYCIAALFLVYVLYEDNKKNGCLKNIIASGLSRVKIFGGQIVVSLLISVILLVVTLLVYIVSARLLLQLTGPVLITDLLYEIVAVAPIAVAALILALAVVLLFDKSFLGIFCWFCVLYLVPKLLFYIGLQIPTVYEIAMWMPYNFFGSMEVNQQVCAPIWNTARGLSQCLISGFAGIIIFGSIGILRLRKKEF